MFFYVLYLVLRKAKADGVDSYRVRIVGRKKKSSIHDERSVSAFTRSLFSIQRCHRISEDDCKKSESRLVV
jgi:hypothetical protein